VSTRTVTVAGLAVLAIAALGVGQSACGSEADHDRATVREAAHAIDDAVARVERQASLSSGPASDRAAAVRALLEKWYDTHTAVFAVDPQAAAGRFPAMLGLLAGISPDLVVAGRDGAPTDIDDAAVARALEPDPTTRALAAAERMTVDRQVGVLQDTLSDRPASMVIAGDPDAVGATVDDVLVRLQSRLQLLYPGAADRVMQLRLALRR
jgi:hypothetical protein